MRTTVRWLVPIAVTAAVAGGVAVTAARADTAPQLPDRTPQQVMAAVAGSTVRTLSGTVLTRTELGLPSVPQLQGDAGSARDAQGLITRFLSGENTLRVWTDGPTRQRVQLLDSFDELDVVHNGSEVWTYAAKQNEVQHGSLPDHGDAASSASRSAAAAAGLTPAELAQRALAAADPTTAVSLDTPADVAGRPAYLLRLTPRTTATLVDHVAIAVDSVTGVPLQVDVFARGHAVPAVHSGFTSVDFARPSAQTFTFTPPKGARVSQLDLGDAADRQHATSGGTSGSGDHSRVPSPSAEHARPTVTGTGWASVVELPAGSGPLPSALTGGTSPGTDGGTSGNGPDATALLEQLTRPVAGGRALTSTLFSVLLTNDGRVLFGAVPVQSLVDAAQR